MSAFGWSLPPGCGTLPGEEDSFCAVCGLNEDECICPECPECGHVGDPECYIQHGMEISPAQAASLAAQEAKWNAANQEDREE